MKKLYTIEECFKMAGEKFPFIVDWHSGDNSHGIVKDVKIISRELSYNLYKWYHEGVIANSTFFHWSEKNYNDPSFDIKSPEYRKDFANLVDED